MTTKENVFLRVIPIGLAGIVSISYMVSNIDHDFFFDFIPELFIAVISLSVLAWTILKDRKEFRKSKNKLDYLPSLTGLISGLVFFVTLFIFNLRDSSPTKLRCVNADADFNGISIDFRQDGTYKLANWCLGADYYRGTYQIKDSIITLDGVGIAEMIGSNQLMFHTDTIIGTDTSFMRSLHQVDSAGRMIDGSDYFVIR